MSSNDSNIKAWSTTASENTDSTINGWEDNLAANNVKQRGRGMMADIKNQWDDAQWLVRMAESKYARASATSFTVSGSDETEVYQPHRRIKVFQGSETLYGEVVSSSYSSPNTTVNVALESGSLSATSFSSVGVAIISPKNSSLPRSNIQQHQNLLINGDFIVGQRGTSFTDSGSANNNASYTLDRWKLLSDGNDVVDVAQETSDVPSDGRAAVKFTVATINKKFGIIQALENKDCEGLIGDVASLSFKAKIGAAGQKLDKLRAAIISWQGTADSLTSEAVTTGSWAVEGTNPTLNGSWTFESTPVDLTLGATYQLCKVEDVAINASNAKNVAAFIWSDSADGSLGETAYISNVQLNVGPNAATFEQKPFAEVLLNCKRYYEKSYAIGTAPGTATTTGERIYPMPFGDDGSTRILRFTHFELKYDVDKFKAPTVTLYSPAITTADRVNLIAYSGTTEISSNDKTATSGGIYTSTIASEKNTIYLTNDTTEIATWTVSTSKYYQAFLRYHYTADAEL